MEKMDALALLKEVSKRDGVDGSIVETLEDARELIGEGIDDLNDALIRACLDAPEDIYELCRDVIEAGGKRIRPLLCLLTYRAFSGTGPLPLDLAIGCELLHNATLLHDDVIDEGDLRRGRPAARVVHGNAVSILAGDYLLVKTTEIVSARGSLYMGFFLKTLREIVGGELTQLKRRGSTKTSEDEYFRIIEGKTASLFCFAAYVGALASGVSEQLSLSIGEFGWHTGVAFQLIDDILDFTADASRLGKNLLADISEGKMTLPVIRAAQISPELTSLLDTLSREDVSDELIGRIAKLVSQTGVIEDVREKAARHTSKAVESISKMPELNDRAGTVLEKLARALLTRTA